MAKMHESDLPADARCPRCGDDWPHVENIDRQPARVWRWFRFSDVIVTTTRVRCLTCQHRWTINETRPAESIR